MSFSLFNAWDKARTIRHLCRTRLGHFYPALHIVPNPLPAPHIDALLRILDEFMDPASTDEIIVILMPPGSAKTLVAGRVLPALVLGSRPRSRVITVSASAQHAEKSGAAVKAIIESPAFRKLFPHIGISKSSSSITDFSITVDGRSPGPDVGTFRAFGATSAILGNRAELAICDDVVSIEAANNQTTLAKVYEAFEKQILTRLTPNSKLVVICQRLNINDLAGRILADAEASRAAGRPHRRVRLVKMPMLCTEPESDPLGRAIGEPLWPAYYTSAQLADAQRNEMIWKTLYQQEPPSEAGTKIDPGCIQIVDVVPFADNCSTYIAMDIAISVNSGDYTVILIALVDSSRNLWIVDAHRHRCEPSATVQRLIDLVGTHHPLEVLADDDNIMKSVQSLISAMARDNRQPIPFKLLPMRGADKETRASAIVGWFHQRRVFFKRAAWNDWLRNELLIFPNAIGDGVDDGVDALSLLGRRLNQLAVPAAPSKPSPPVDPRGTFYSATFAELFEHNEQGRTGRPRIH